MGVIIEFPCRDYYCDDEYEDYYAEEEYESWNYDNDCGVEILKENWVRGFVRKCLMFVLMRL